MRTTVKAELRLPLCAQSLVSEIVVPFRSLGDDIPGSSQSCSLANNGPAECNAQFYRLCLLLLLFLCLVQPLQEGLHVALEHIPPLHTQATGSVLCFRRRHIEAGIVRCNGPQASWAAATGQHSQMMQAGTI